MSDLDRSDPTASPQPPEAISWAEHEESLPARLEKLKFYRSETQHEFNLLSNRVGAYITSQSFLVIAYATSLGNTNPRWGSLFRLVFPIALAIVGLTTSLLVWPGIQGACTTIELWREKLERLYARDPRLDDYRVARPLGTSRQGKSIDTIHVRSLLFARWAPAVFAAAWSVFGLLTLTLSLFD